jgi:hypothetical protein
MHLVNLIPNYYGLTSWVYTGERAAVVGNQEQSIGGMVRGCSG